MSFSLHKEKNNLFPVDNNQRIVAYSSFQDVDRYWLSDELIAIRKKKNKIKFEVWKGE